MYKKILLPTDGSKNAEIAAEPAFLLASRSGAEVVVLNVIETPRFLGLRSSDKDELFNNLKENGQKSFDRISNILTELKKDNKCDRDVKLSFEFKEGSPAEVILEIIENEGIDLVVMGTSGKRGLDRFLLGSVTENTMRSTKIPVLVVR